LSLTVARSIPTVKEAASAAEVRIWTPLPLAAMFGFAVALLGGWRWYQQLEGFASGLDATTPEFTEKWMPLWYANCAAAAMSQIVIPVWFWLTRDRALERLAPAAELRRYFIFFSILLTWGFISLVTLVLGAADAAWHQVVVRDTSLTPSHIVIFFGATPLSIGFGFSAFFSSLTRIPHFAGKLSRAMFLVTIGPFLGLPSVAYNEWGHAFWLMEELFIAPLHWGFVVLSWTSVAMFAVIAQTLPRVIELIELAGRSGEEAATVAS